jgi:hypothetical protein
MVPMSATFLECFIPRLTLEKGSTRNSANCNEIEDYSIGQIQECSSGIYQQIQCVFETDISLTGISIVKGLPAQ